MEKGVKKGRLKEVGIAAQRVLPIAALLFTLRRGLREFIVEAGIQALEGLLEDERTRICGPRYRHATDRRGVRAGHAPGELVLGGRRIRIRRPRARSADGDREIHLPVWEQFSREDPLDHDAVEKMVIGVSTRKYVRALEPLDEDIAVRGTSKSAVSRRFVAATKKKLDEWLKRRLEDIALTSIFIDGLVFGEHVVLIALGVDVDGHKHVLGIHEGATENAVACGALLDDVIERGVRTDRSLLFTVDGSKSLVKAITTRFGRRALIQRCQVHKARNVREHLPKDLHPSVAATLRQAYGSTKPETAKKILENLARRLDDDHPRAAASIREGLSETLTVMRLGLQSTFARTFSTTNPIENLNSSARWTTRNVKRWRTGSMVERWACAAVCEASQKFRRLKGWKSGMPALISALRENDRKIEGEIKPDIDSVSKTA